MEEQKFIPEGWEEISSQIEPRDNLYELMEQGTVMQGIVSACDKDYNLHVSFGKDLKGTIPRNEVEAINVNEIGLPKPSICVGKLNKYVQFKIKEIDNNGEIFLSRKDVGKEALSWVNKDLQCGQIVKGIVKNIQSYGAFIEIGGGVVGLLHIEDISIARIKTPFERLKIGQKLNIMIKSIDRTTNRVLLTYKELLGTWEENIKGLQEGMITRTE